MVEDLNSAIDGLQEEQVVEAANAILAGEWGFADLRDAADRVAAETGVDRAEIEQLAGQVRTESEKLTDMLRAVLKQVAQESDEGGRAAIADTVATAGEKQIVMGGGEIALAAVLLAFYIAHRTGGKVSDEKTTEIVENDEGRMQVTIREKTTYLDPFGAIGQLIKRMIGYPGKVGDNDAAN